MHNIQYVD